MYGLTDEFWSKWSKKRRKSLIGFAVVGTVIGMDASIIFSTLYDYLHHDVKTENPEMWYGLIIASFFVSSTIFGGFAGRWLDTSRSILTYINFSLFLQAVGLLLYVIPYHPAFLLLGRTICGLADPYTSVISGEIIRIHSEEDVGRVITIFTALYSFGFIIGPAMNFFFKNIDFDIGSFHVDNLNFIGIFMIALLMIAGVVANLLVYDCSQEFDLKAYLTSVGSEEGQNNFGENINGARIECSNINLMDIRNYGSNDEPTSHFNTSIIDKTDDSHSNRSKTKDAEVIVNSFAENSNIQVSETTGDAEKETSAPSESTSIEAYSARRENGELIDSKRKFSIKEIFRAFLMNEDTLLTLLATFFFVYALSAASGGMPLFVTVVLKFDLDIVSYLYITTGVSDLLFLLILAKFSSSNRSIYVVLIFSIVSLIAMGILMMLFKVLKRHYIADLIMVFAFGLLTTLGWTFDKVCLQVLFANMIPSEIQSFSEAVRSGLGRIGEVLGMLTTIVIVQGLLIWSSAIIFVCLMLLVGFILRRENLISATKISIRAL